MSFRVLIVDDEFGLADVIAEVLAEAGYDVAIAINGQLGLVSMDEVTPDLVLLDMMMPVVDGPAMLRAIRINPKYADVPVVMMTSLPEALPVGDASLYQAVLHKPFTQEKLLSTLQKLLDRPPDFPPEDPGGSGGTLRH
jgi:CheY-like chemotaxis protein